MAKKNTGWAIVGTLPVLGFILVLLASKKDEHTKFYAKQGLVLGLASIAAQAVLTLLVVTVPLVPLVGLLTLVLWIVSVVNAISGKMKPTPLTGDIAKRLRI